MNFCTNCGNQLNDIVKFCSHCGYTLKNTISPNETLNSNKKKSFKWMMKKKKILIGTFFSIVAIFFIYTNYLSGEDRAFDVVKNFFYEECLKRGCEVKSFYDIETNLKQKEDRDLEKSGEYRIEGGVLLKSKKGGEDEYYHFGMNVGFYNGEFYRAGWPSINSDHSKNK